MTDKCFEIGIIDNLQDLHDAMELRREVFVEEEKVSSSKEFDKNDLVGAVHFYIKDNNKMIGTLRARLFPNIAKLERLCLKKEYRRTAAAKQLIEYSFNYCAHKGYHKVCGLCTPHLLDYWDKLEMKKQDHIPPIQVDNMKLYTVVKDITPSPDAPSVQNPQSMISADSETATKDYVNKRLSYIMAALIKRQKN